MEESQKTINMHPSFANTIKKREELKNKLSKIKHKIGVYSAKGGVGKTTVSVNLAYTLAKRGFKVGLMDADIDCPNVGMFMGINDWIDLSKRPLVPIEKFGFKVVSTSMLIDDKKKPMIWRGPIITKMITEVLEGIEWGELDYLIIDLPPGTSDGPLTIMQLLNMEGFIIVTTPQFIAGINSIKAGGMVKRLNIGIIGVIENMSNEKEGVSESTKNVVHELGSSLLGTIRNRSILSELSDKGIIAASDDESILKEFEDIVKNMKVF